MAATLKRTHLLGGALLAALLACAPACAKIAVGRVQMVIPAARFRALNLAIFPDGSMFEINTQNGEAFFAAEGGARNSNDQGTIELGRPTPSAPLAELAPLWTSSSGQPIPSLRPGYMEPPPDRNAGGFPAGASFDRDYAGGGPALYDANGGDLIEVYHGEYHKAYPSAEPFYTSLGLAVSHDLGRTFKKLGLVVRPQIPPNQPIPPGKYIATVPSSSGSIVQAGTYVYLYYSDLSPDGSCDGSRSALKNLPCIAVARAPVSELLTDASRGIAAPWEKYYRGQFGEPGIGGRFSPLIVTSGPTWARWPAVVYDPISKLFLMTDVLVTSGKPVKTAVEIRESQDGLKWGPATQIVSVEEPQGLNYPSFVPLGAGACTAGMASAAATCSKYTLLFVREQNASDPGKPFTRDLLGVDITLAAVAARVAETPVQ